MVTSALVEKLFNEKMRDAQYGDDVVVRPLPIRSKPKKHKLGRKRKVDADRYPNGRIKPKKD